jgi:tRNA(Ile)-lysidine synthase
LRILRKLLEQVEKDNRRYGLLKKKEALVVGLSGGPDSTALLFILSKLRRKYGWRLIAAHLNHGIHPAEARRHERLAEKTAERLGVVFRLKRVSCRTLAKRFKRSLEDAGRIERYRFFREAAARERAPKIVTAHTLDDQAETVLLRILRGSGLRGLAAIPRKRPEGRCEVVRPLLGCEKSDLLRMLKEERIPYALDASNRDGLFTRNRVRLDLLPGLAKRFNPRIKHTLASLQTVCEEAQDYLRHRSAKALRTCSGRSRGGQRGILLKLGPLKRLHPAISREVVCQAILARKGDLNRLDYHHISSILELVHSPKDGLQTHLPDGLVVRRTGDTLSIC